MTDVVEVCYEHVHKIENEGSLAPKGWLLNIQDASCIAVVAKRLHSLFILLSGPYRQIISQHTPGLENYYCSNTTACRNHQ